MKKEARMINKKSLGLIIFLLIGILIVNIGFNSSFASVSAEELKVTQEHPFLINGQWIKAKDLKIGDYLTTIDGRKARITKLTDVKLDTPIDVYNLEANPYNDFVVNGIVVHNSGNGWKPKSVKEVLDMNNAERRKYIAEFYKNKYGVEPTPKQINDIMDVHDPNKFPYNPDDPSMIKRGRQIQAKIDELVRRDFTYNQALDFVTNGICGEGKTIPPIETPNGPVDVPQPGRSAQLNKEKALEWANSATDPVLKSARLKLVEHLEKVSFEDFLRDLQLAIERFDAEIGDSPYVEVMMSEGKSQQWVYDLASKWETKKPSEIIFLDARDRVEESVLKDKLRALFKKGQRNLVFRDDAMYTGGQINENINQLMDEFYSFLAYADRCGKKLKDRQLHITVVVSRTALSGENRILELKSRSLTTKVISGGKNDKYGIPEKIKEIQDIFNLEEFKALESDFLKHMKPRKENIGPEGLRDDTVTLYYDFKVPDALSFDDRVSDFITAGDTNVPFTEVEGESIPYKIKGTDFYNRWLCKINQFFTPKK